MAKPMRKNSFVEGTLIAYAAIVFTKLLGAFYNIPFYEIIGERGGVIYSYAYTIYSLFLDISTAGIPIAISIVISEYSALGKYRSKERAYTIGLRFVAVVSLIACAALLLFAKPIAGYFIADMTEGVTIDEVTWAIRAVSLCLLIVPFLSMRRGYMQGHKLMSAPSASQVIEQVVRIAVVLIGAFVAIHILHCGVTVGVCVALLGAAAGALVAYMYLYRKQRQNTELFATGEDCTEDAPAPTKEILRKIFSYCITIIIVSTSTSVYHLVDMKLLLVGLKEVGYSDEATQVITSIASSWIPKICMIIAALSIGMTSSIAPHMAESYAQGDLKGVNRKLNQALSTILAISLPIAAGMIVLAQPVYCVFYGQSDYGASILQWALVLNVIGSMTNVVSMGMQSMDRGKAVCLFTVIGIVINTALDLPLIYLFNSIGLPAYLGATAASIIGQVVTVAMLLGLLHRQHRFTYLPALRVLGRTLIPTALTIAAVLLLRLVWPVIEERGLLQLVQLGAFALIGAVVYLPLAFKLGALDEIVSADAIKRFFNKLGRKG